MTSETSTPSAIGWGVATPVAVAVPRDANGFPVALLQTVGTEANAPNRVVPSGGWQNEDMDR